MQPPNWLQPRPISLQSEPCRHYLNHDTGHRYAVSITTAIGRIKLTMKDRQAIEAYRPQWEPRGIQVHSALETFLQTQMRTTGSDYQDYIDPLLSHAIWDRVEVVGSELVVADDQRDWAGTLDVAVKWPDGTYGILDLKTKGSKSSKKQDVQPQLGAAAAQLIDHYRLPLGRCGVLWSYPCETKLETYSADECLSAWVDLWDIYCQRYRAF